MDAITFTVTPLGQNQSVTINVSALREHLALVPDQRKPRGVRYPLAVLLVIAVLAKLCGQSQVHALAHWAQERAPELATLFGLTRPRMPHPTTWTRILGHRVAADAIEDALRPVLVPPSAHVPARASRQVALDGKTLRGSSPADAKTKVHLVSAYQVERGAPLLQVKVGAKANELVVVPALLAQLDLDGVVVTGDALFAQRNLSTQIVAAGGDYCWIVKENQPRLYDDLCLLFGPPPDALPGCSPMPDDCVSTTSLEKAHGRLDERVLTSTAS